MSIYVEKEKGVYELSQDALDASMLETLNLVRQFYNAETLGEVVNAMTMLRTGDWFQAALIIDVLILANIKSQAGQTGSLETLTKNLAGLLDETNDHLSRMSNRKAFETQTKKTHIAVIEMFYGGKCPCCQLEQILNDEHQLVKEVGQEEHWFSRTLNRLDETWLTCRGCNIILRKAKKRAEHKLTFDLYQRRVEEYQAKCGNGQGNLPGFD